MSNVCSKCGNNLYGNKTKCPFCGAPISSNRNYSANNHVSRPNNSNKSLNSSSYQNNNNTYKGYNNNQSNYQSNYNRPVQRNSATSYDSGSAGWGLLGFCFPIVGIILYLVWQQEKPLTAKACLNGALISIVVGFIFGFFSACANLAAY